MADRLLLTRITPPTMAEAATTFCQVRWSMPVHMLTTVAMMGER